jgi:C4-dicarboxylate transporter DctM subunit
MPLTLVLIACLFVWKAGEKGAARALAAVAAITVLALGFFSVHGSLLTRALAGGLALATLLGAPVFAAMGVFGLLLFYGDGTPVAAVSAEIFRLIESPTLPAIPLLTACGYVLAEGQASHRLVRFFRSLFGWMPGGLGILVAGVCALFTTFTGGSCVTIIALGGLFYPILREDGYSEGFSLGLASMAEASAIACAYVIVTQCLVMGDHHILRDLPRVLLKALALVGAVLILLSSAMGLTSYLVDAQIPGLLLA